MKQTDKWAIAIVAGVVYVMTCVLIAASSSTVYGAVLVNGTLTPTVRVYLPYLSKEEPPTLMPTPTNTPTPTQTPLPSGVYVLPNYSFYQTSWGALHIVGEVMNNTSSHLTFVKISANLFSSEGELLDTDYTYAYLDDLPAGHKTCFDVLFLNPPSGWSYYEFEAPTYWTDGNPLPNLTILNDSGSYDPTDSGYKIIGQVRNDHGSRVEYVNSVGTLYNSSGTVLGCGYTYVNSTHLNPGQVSAFKIDYYGRDYGDVDSYRLQVDGNPQ